jgi:hypothetical protein
MIEFFCDIHISNDNFILSYRNKMNKTITVYAITTAVAMLISGMFTTSAMLLPDVALAQKSGANSTTKTAATLNNGTGANAGFLTYENNTLGMKIQYPSNWTKQASGRGITFLIPLGKDNFLAKLNASALVGFPTNMTTKSMADRVITSYRHFLPGFQMKSYISNATLAGNNNAVKIAYTYTDQKNNMFSGTDTATIKNNKLYVIQYYYYIKSPKQQAYSQTLQKMVDSFQTTR